MFLAIEGTDGSGKTTQFKLLVAALRRSGMRVKTVDFPQYGKPSAYFVEQYLNGRFGGVKEVGPYQASLFYALDRYQLAPKVREWLRQGYTIVANRYVLSSAGHQGSKFLTSAQRKQFWKWLLGLEYGILGAPRPDVNVLLHVPAKTAQKLAKAAQGRKAAAYLKGRKHDIHEGNQAHMKAAERAYLEFAKTYHVPVVKCIEQGRLLTPKEVHRKVLAVVDSVHPK